MNADFADRRRGLYRVPRDEGAAGARARRRTRVDELNAYYDPALKRRGWPSSRTARFPLRAGRHRRRDGARGCRAGEPFDVILHLAAQAGVRYALEDPGAYTRSNLVGHHNVLEFARRHDGLSISSMRRRVRSMATTRRRRSPKMARADKPVSYYGATKRAGELLSHSYAELFGLKQTGLRFFTVYGPWGRPDMAYWLFTDAILNGKPIPVFGGGKLRRDFTYIDDIVAALVRIVETPFASEARARRIGSTISATAIPKAFSILIRAIEQATGRKAKIEQAEGPRGRRPRNLCRHLPGRARFRFRSQDFARRGHRPVRCLVCRLLQVALTVLFLSARAILRAAHHSQTDR